MRDLQSMRRAFGDNPVNFRTGVMPTFKINASVSNNALWVSAVLSVKRRVKRQAVICRRHASMRAGCWCTCVQMSRLNACYVSRVFAPVALRMRGRSRGAIKREITATDG